jgi:hypothetical protein
LPKVDDGADDGAGASVGADETPGPVIGAGGAKFVGYGFIDGV